MKIISECDGLKMLIKNGAVIKRIESIDDKGDDISYSLKSGNTEVMIKCCPCCGEQISNLQVPKGKCGIKKCPECGTFIKDTSEGEYCPKCEPPPVHFFDDECPDLPEE